MNKKGFTLIEMVIAVSVMAVIVMGGTMVFYRTLSSSGINQAQLNVNATTNQVLQAIENNIRYQKIRSVSQGGVDYEREDCVLAGRTGTSVYGDTLTIYDEFDTTVYSLIVDAIASNSAIINSPNLIVRSVRYDWFCTPGSNDRLRVTILSNDRGLTTSVPDRTYLRDINMYNSY